MKSNISKHTILSLIPESTPGVSFIKSLPADTKYYSSQSPRHPYDIIICILHNERYVGSLTRVRGDWNVHKPIAASSR